MTTNGKHVGILALEAYTPSTFIAQTKLEEHIGVAPGRYSIGLGQDGLAVTGDAEDVNSLCLTVVHSLLEKYNIKPEEVGRLEVGTETLVDKSKSTKTILMDLFPNNTDIEGATVINACYGGTAALLNAFLWVESDGWDGRYAIVVAADIAAYARGPARPTCGAGAVAVLIGRDAPLAFSNPKEKATHATNVWDFFKPDHTVEYPTVDGALSQVCYFQALEDVYKRFSQKLEEIDGGKAFGAESPDYMVFHAPYNKLVQKSYARLFLLDARRQYEARSEEEKKESDTIASADSPLAEWLSKPIGKTYNDKGLEKALKNVSAAAFKERLSDANAASKAVGNTYTASVFLGLCSLVDRAGARGELTPGKKVVVFSYGSGALASLYRLHV
jgi:hydroxymethylglutaryl-CoA synthase